MMSCLLSKYDENLCQALLFGRENTLSHLSPPILGRSERGRALPPNDQIPELTPCISF